MRDAYFLGSRLPHMVMVKIKHNVRVLAWCLGESLVKPIIGEEEPFQVVAGKTRALGQSKSCLLGVK